jgi:rubrerythrin
MTQQTTGIDFSKLSLKDALDLAVLVEEEAKERYEEFAHQMETHRTPEAAKFFKFMSANEERHRSELAARRKKLFGDEPSAVNPQMLFDVEAPEYDEARAFMTLRSALATALRAEEKAHAFFVGALPQLTNKEVHDLFDELREEEVEHQMLVKKEMAKAPPDPEFPAEEFVDKPVGE